MKSRFSVLKLSLLENLTNTQLLVEYPIQNTRMRHKTAHTAACSSNHCKLFIKFCSKGLVILSLVKIQQFFTIAAETVSLIFRFV